MAFQSLYRRYRPLRFSDVRGQEHVVRALRNAVREDRVGHAYLFSGPRGTGKTSTARILAKALNCEHLVDGEPDGSCESCLAIDAGTSYDVQELDAASNNGVEAIRELISRVALGSPGRTKVYILDEVHMLSGAASAALLKTLEEPPAHVVFVLATTDPQKVLPTIRSRTQHYPFHLLSAEELAEHVAWVIHDAELGLPDDVIPYVVRQGTGSPRDTLSALDQVAAAGGVLDRGDALDDLLDAIAAANTGAALAAVADAVASGRDPRVLGEAVLARLRDVFLVRMGASTDHLPTGDGERVRAWADQLGDRATTRALELVGDALLEMRQAPDPRIPLEVAMVKLIRVGADASVEGLAARVDALEAALDLRSAGGALAVRDAGSGDAEAGSGRSGGEPSSDDHGGGRGAKEPSSNAPSAPGAQAFSPPTAAPTPPEGDRTVQASTGSANAELDAPVAGDAVGRSRPADAARAELASRRGERAASDRPSPSSARAPASSGSPRSAGPPSSSPPTGSNRPAGSLPSPSGPPLSPTPTPSEPTLGTAPTGTPPTPPSPAPPAPANGASGKVTPPSSGSPPGDEATSGQAQGATPTAPSIDPGPPAEPGLDRAQVEAGWETKVLPALGGMVKAMFAAGRITDVDGGSLVLAVPNDVHRQRCEQKRDKVDQALSAAFDHPLRLRLVVDELGGSEHSSSEGPADRQANSGSEDEDLSAADVRELPDAPDAPTQGIDALTKAFPGSQLVEEP
ncbi:MAG: DNA polymerase III subunit gamma/tau [Acidimicrobiales bacterium]